MEKLYTCKEMSELTGIDTQSLRRWDREGKFKAFRYVEGGNLFYTQEHVDSIINKSKFTCNSMKEDDAK